MRVVGYIAVSPTLIVFSKNSRLSLWKDPRGDTLCFPPRTSAELVFPPSPDWTTRKAAVRWLAIHAVDFRIYYTKQLIGVILGKKKQSVLKIYTLKITHDRTYFCVIFLMTWRFKCRRLSEPACLAVDGAETEVVAAFWSPLPLSLNLPPDTSFAHKYQKQKEPSEKVQCICNLEENIKEWSSFEINISLHKDTT